MDAACPKRVIRNCLKMAVEPREWSTRIARWSMRCHTLPHIFGCVPATRAYNHFIYPHFYNFNTIFYKFTNSGITLLSCPATSQRSSTSDSLMCTSTTSSIGDPGSCRVIRLWEQPPAMASESDHRSSYASLSSPPMTTSQSREHCLFGSCSSSWSTHLILSSSPSLCLGSASVVGGLGSASSCSSSSSSDVEELTSRRALNLAIWATSWETRGT